MDEDYNDANRAFLQAFMSRSTMTFEEAQPILAAIFSAHERRSISPDDVTQEHLSSYISSANSAISPFDLEIRSSLRQLAKRNNNETPEGPPSRVYALVNTTSDPLTQLATTYTADEIAFVKRVLDYMFVTNNTRLCEGMVIRSTQAMHLAHVSADASRRRATSTGTQQTQQTQGGAAQNLSMKQAEEVMKRLVEEGWLEKSRKDFFSLTPRALMELRGWLVLTYNDTVDGRRIDRIKFCAACKDLITVGQRCGTRDCSGRLHDHCMQNFFRMQQTRKCPVCKKDWPGDNFVGERAVTSANRRQSSNIPQQTETSSRTQNGHTGDLEEEVDGESED
ncbi:uncharacterized protein N7459_000822 [Penicillium hispanicum]|uniref:uncharacterized protein n=1 Tax=Penicillium hispanicum TaxID=1080232 RepID=UPI0025411071|nr:uncharacterized protein N7459_000822 [Penicillium hispanicum]KAJ5594614.1 hypothetical protein N7459_000822 [Penicillium hispanicum]